MQSLRWKELIIVAAAICTIVGTLIVVRQYWNSPPPTTPQLSSPAAPPPSVELVATVSSGPYILPFVVEERFDELRESENLKKVIESSQALRAVKDKKFRETITTEISKLLSEHMWNYRFYILEGAIGLGEEIARISPRIRGYWDIDLENKGSLVARGVKLRLPHIAYVKVSGEKSDHETIHSRLIEIAELHPLEKVSIRAWHGDTFGRDEFQITHSEGVGRLIRK